MALRLRRDVQKASYYVWFLGAEEAKGLRGARVINSVLPYLIDRSRQQEPLKVTLQVSHKGIKILQGSSKHFIPHSAITSSVLTEDIVACVLLLYNPATKCPLHVHGYRCDSESTAEALHQQLQTLINRPENQKRFEELETRLGILPPLPSTAGGHNKSASSSSSAHMLEPHNGHKLQQPPQRYPSSSNSSSHMQSQKAAHHRRHDSSPKRFNSSLGSDTGNSTRESECSEEHSGGGGSPISRSPPIMKALHAMPPLPSPELFDSLAAELRAKLNGNGPPLLLPPRDYDAAHRSKGNLAAIELRRCRNELIVGGTKGSADAGDKSGKLIKNQVSSRGSSGIGSDLAPSPERQEFNTSSDDEHWSNEADNSVIALKPSQIAMERNKPLTKMQHTQLSRKSAIQPPEDSYLRDLPAKPYEPRASANGLPKDIRSKAPTASTWTREDEIKPIIMRPADYDAKFNRIMQAEQKQEYKSSQRSADRDRLERVVDKPTRETDKYNEINRLLSKKLSIEREEPSVTHHYRSSKQLEENFDDFDEPDRSAPPIPAHGSSAAAAAYRKENLTDKQKFIEYSSGKKYTKGYMPEPEPPRHSNGRHRYADGPAEMPFESAALQTRNKYAAVHRGGPAVAHHSPERHAAEIAGHRTAERPSRRERQREEPADSIEPRESSRHSRERKRDNNYSHSNERNPYREPESIPYMQSMEKMIKSSAMRYKSPEKAMPHKDELLEHSKLGQRTSKSSYGIRSEDGEREPLVLERGEYNNNNKYNKAGGHRMDAMVGAAPASKERERYREPKDKYRSDARGSRYDLSDDRDEADFKPMRRRGSIEHIEVAAKIYDEWSDEGDHSPPPPPEVRRARAKSKDRWQPNGMPREVIKELSRELARDANHRGERDMPSRDKSLDMPLRERERERERDRERDREREQFRDAPYHEEHCYDLPPRESRSGRGEHHDYSERHRDYSPEVIMAAQRSSRNAAKPEHYRGMEKQRMPAPVPHPDMYPAPTPPPSKSSGMSNAKSLSNLNNKSGGYRHSYAEPTAVFPRTGGRVGLAAVNPY